MTQDGGSVAVGDEAGKIFLVSNITNLSSNFVIQTLHWHANGVNSLSFMSGTPFLVSGGAESVLVQWHLQKQAKTFVSRLGDKVTSLAVSGNHYGVTLGDNSIRVIRNDNNKVVVSHKNAHIDTNEMGCSLGSVSNVLMIPNGDTL